MSEVMAAEPTNAGVAPAVRPPHLHHMGRYDEAEAAYRGARVLGLPAGRTLPGRWPSCAATSTKCADHRTPDNWQGLSRLQPVVPPVEPQGPAKADKASTRTP